MLKRTVDTDRDQLIGQRHAALNMLTCVEEKLTECAIRATEGDATAFKKYASLTAEANRHRQEAEVFERALAAFDKSRAEAQAEKFKLRRDAANERRKKLIDNAEAEQRPQIERQIARFEACGDKHQAAIWRDELAKLRDTLEKQHPPIGTKPKGPSTVVGITNVE